jgi:hypothetical protein
LLRITESFSGDAKPIYVFTLGVDDGSSGECGGRSSAPADRLVR